MIAVEVVSTLTYANNKNSERKTSQNDQIKQVTHECASIFELYLIFSAKQS